MKPWIIIVLCIVVFVVIGGAVLLIRKWKKEKAIRNRIITKDNSQLYKAIQKLNEKYQFSYDVHDPLVMSTTAKSKRSLEKIDLYEFASSMLREYKLYYEGILNKVDENKRLYDQYILDYKDIEKYTNEEEFNQLNIEKISFKTFNECEKHLYQNGMKKKPVVSVHAFVQATYTSPAGRSNYQIEINIPMAKLRNIIEKNDADEESLTKERSAKERALVAKKEKERKLRELDKKEKELNEREEMIKAKESEFLKATEGHIYSAEQVVTEDTDKSVEKMASPYEKLQALKEQFENDEISREEYDKRRNELL